MIDHAFGQPEDRALDHQGDEQLRVGGIALIRLGGLSLVENRPQPLESLLSKEARKQPGENSYSNAEAPEGWVFLVRRELKGWS